MLVRLPGFSLVSAYLECVLKEALEEEEEEEEASSLRETEGVRVVERLCLFKHI